MDEEEYVSFFSINILHPPPPSALTTPFLTQTWTLIPSCTSFLTQTWTLAPLLLYPFYDLDLDTLPVPSILLPQTTFRHSFPLPLPLLQLRFVQSLPPPPLPPFHSSFPFATIFLTIPHFPVPIPRFGPSLFPPKFPFSSQSRFWILSLSTHSIVQIWTSSPLACLLSVCCYYRCC